ncbi:MAG TPA: class I SAM-dependent methyltransferase [Cyclobacteriaceae bacterium]|jgi:predicted SAM-dependent methyltransferase|nr:class I SAM-dependent methyltransferase [Cyclobacteriaceae bacterium]
MGNLAIISLKANDYSNPSYIGSRFRKKRFQFFEEKLALLEKPVTILDIGGTARFWTDENYQDKDVLITIINLKTEKSNSSNIRVMEGNACDLSMFADKSFDIAFSNSLIEHLHTTENQSKMASEAIRVANHYFIQTPNKYFPIEPHFKFPFFQFLPKKLQVFLQTKTSIINGVKYSREYAENIIEEIRLLSRKEIQGFFPNGDLEVERFMGLAKSFMLYKFPK